MTSNDYNNLACFLRDRIYLIDITKRSNEIVFTIEDHFKNYEITLDSNSLKCSCESFRNKISVCRHIKFILEKIDKVDNKNKKSKSCDQLGTFNKMFYVDIKKNLDPNKFESDHNPRYKEYKILHDTDYNGSCYICLEKLSKKIIRCKHCSKYYHEKCIYGWLRHGAACTCPNCRGQWI
jgi:hypothetical protein